MGIKLKRHEEDKAHNASADQRQESDQDSQRNYEKLSHREHDSFVLELYTDPPKLKNGPENEFSG